MTTKGEGLREQAPDEARNASEDIMTQTTAVEYLIRPTGSRKVVASRDSIEEAVAGARNLLAEEAAMLARGHHGRPPEDRGYTIYRGPDDIILRVLRDHTYVEASTPLTARERVGVLLMATAAQLSPSARDPRHTLTVQRGEEPGRSVYYVGTCACGEWTRRAAFRALVETDHKHHLADAIRAQLKAIAGKLAPSNEPSTGSMADIRAAEAKASRMAIATMRGLERDGFLVVESVEVVS